MAAKKIIDSATRQAARHGLLIVIVAIVALEATSLLQYYYSRKAISEESVRRAEGQLQMTELQIMDVVNRVETAVKNTVWAVQQQIDRPDSLAAITRRMLSTNDVIVGSTVALTRKNQSPYSYKKGGDILSSSLATEEYDYQHQEWFVKPLELRAGYWSEPYFDEGGGNMLMTTYSMPVNDRSGRPVAVLTADISLDWLTSLVGNVRVYPNAFSTLVSRAGQIMVCPVESLVMRRTMQEWAAASQEADALGTLNNAILSGQAGNTSLKYKGKVHYVFFDPIEVTGWAMSIVVPEDEIYAGLQRLGTLVLFLQLLGLALLVLVLWHTIKSQRDMNLMEAKKNRIEGELQIASDIQMSMIPKSFPPYPARGEVDMFANVLPAKEVGGDFYDFYIRENRLFFCIGDVSGKGVPASLVMAVTRSLFRTVSAHEMSPQRIVTAMNNSMADMNESNMFVTLFCGVLDLGSGHLRYCNAGHNAPVLVGEGRPRFLHVNPNLPLGVMPDMTFEEQEVDLPTGTGIFTYTDGLNEAENPEHELFGNERLLAALKYGLDSHKQLAVIRERIAEFVADAPQSDDLTMLYIRYMNIENKEETERHLILHNDIQQIPQLAEFVEAVADAAKLDVGLTMSLNLALEEAVSNVIMYAYPRGSDGLVDVEAVIRKNEVEFIITDSGKPFDPTASPEADTTLGVEDRPIGGLGIFLVKNIMDVVEYERSKDGKNILSMIKKIA